MERGHAVAEGVTPCPHEHDVAEAHITREPCDQVDRVRERRVDQEAREESEGEDRKRGRNDSEDHQDEPEAVEAGAEPRKSHRTIPSGAKRRTGIRTRKATANSRKP